MRGIQGHFCGEGAGAELWGLKGDFITVTEPAFG